MGDNPEFSAKAMGTSSRASAKARMAYWREEGKGTRNNTSFS